ncbi:hypothetical protein KBD59_01860 [Candidatus Gracilibacteria bacterium]|nr:hypothetical protein [Candidatus Gracilibacteria bacterium]
MKKAAEHKVADTTEGLLHPKYDFAAAMTAISKISEIDDARFEKSESGLTVFFNREGKAYNAQFRVNRENTGARTYKLHAEVGHEKGKKMIEKDRTALDYAQIEPAIVFVFHQAFEE